MKRHATKAAAAFLFSFLAGCASVGGESTRFPGIDYPPTPAGAPLALDLTALPECPFEEIGTVEAHAPLDVSGEELERATDRHLATYLDEAERKALAEFRRRVRAMGGHGAIQMTRSLPGRWERHRGEVGESLYEDEDEARGSISYSFGESDRPRVSIRGTVIRFLEPGCRK